MADSRRPKWWQFRISSILLLMVIVALAIALYLERSKLIQERQRVRQYQLEVLELEQWKELQQFREDRATEILQGGLPS